MSTQRNQHFRIDIQSRRNVWIIIHHHGNRAVIRDLREERDDGILVHGEVVVTGDKDEGKIGARFLGLDGFVDHMAGCLAAAAEGDGEVGAVELGGELPGSLDEGGFFESREGNCFAVGAGDYDFFISTASFDMV